MKLRFIVTDTGVGIPKEAQSRIFGAFTQVDESMGRRFGGTGLGLAICEQLVELMDGEIGLESEPGVGSRFWFTVPVEVVGHSRGAETSAPLKDMRALIVDDNATNRRIICQHLGAWGCRVGMAANGLAALEEVRRAAQRGEPFDLVLLDMMMPAMSGLEVAQAIRAEESMRAATLVILTSVGVVLTPEEQSKLGISAQLTKPLRRQELRRALLIAAGANPAQVASAPDRGLERRPEYRSLDADILLAEDNEVNQEVAIAMLEDLGCRVRAVRNGRLAVESLKCERFDLVLMDCQMPEVDGFEATAQIRAWEQDRFQADAQDGGRRARLPIVALTAHAMQGDRERCLKGGMDDHLTKPFSRDELADVISRWLPSGRAAAVSSRPTGGAALDEADEVLDRAALDQIAALSGAAESGLVMRVITTYLETSLPSEPYSRMPGERQTQRGSPKPLTGSSRAVLRSASSVWQESAKRSSAWLGPLLWPSRSPWSGGSTGNSNWLVSDWSHSGRRGAEMRGGRTPRRARPLILAVDDDPVIRLMASEQLRRAGFDVAEADGGEQGVESFERLHPDLVLLDVEMPTLDGFQVCEKIRSSPRGRYIPILILTGLGNIDAIDRAYRVGATDFSSKPVQWVVLAHRIRYILRASESFLVVRSQQAHLDEVQSLARLGSWEVDLTSGSLAASEALRTILGLRDWPAALDAATLFERIHPGDREALAKLALEAIERRAGFSLDHRVVRRDGSERIAHTQARVRSELDGSRLALEGFTQDITERRRAEEQIRYLAHHDALTGLGNRAAFKDRLNSSLQIARRTNRMLAVLHLDLDYFKRINETFGYEAGDALLRCVADRLVDSVRSSDCVARSADVDSATLISRLGGDEFTILLDGISDPQEAGRVAMRISDSLSRPLLVEAQELFVTGSIGIAVSPQDGNDPEALLRNADSAMYHAKDRGRANFQFYCPELNAHALERLQMEARLRRAIEGDELLVYYQPKLELRTGRITGCEALARWRDPERGLVPPSEFIPLAEATGLISRVGKSVLQQASSQARVWHERIQRDFKLAVNLSPAQLKDETVAETISTALRETGFEANLLELEITESALMQNEARASVVLEELSSKGIAISLDDFGTGYSSLSYLKRFHVQTLKIDQSFIHGVGVDSQDTAITAAILSMARDLGLRVVAEGVETEEQLRFLTERGCDEIQGLLVSPPLPSDAFESFLEARCGRAAPSAGGRPGSVP